MALGRVCIDVVCVTRPEFLGWESETGLKSDPNVRKQNLGLSCDVMRNWVFVPVLHWGGVPNGTGFRSGNCFKLLW